MSNLYAGCLSVLDSSHRHLYFHNLDVSMMESDEENLSPVSYGMDPF